MRGDGALWTGKGRRRVGAASSHFWDGEAWEEGGKGLQDKGSPSWALLSVCLHIFLSRDMVSRGRDMSLRNDGNLPFSCANRELRTPSPAFLKAGAAELVNGALRP